MSGTITTIQDCGTIVIVFLDTGEKISPIYFDHRCFGHLLEAEGCDPSGLIGRPVTYENEAIYFED